MHVVAESCLLDEDLASRVVASTSFSSGWLL